jgi:hypothetical protein
MTQVIRSRRSSVVNTVNRWDTVMVASGADVCGNLGGGGCSPGQQRPGGGKMHFIGENTLGLCCARNNTK